MISKLTITPKFVSREIIDKTIGRTWFDFQAGVYDIGVYAHSYMKDFISHNKKRRGGTGKLEKSISFDVSAGAGTARVFWGIGRIDQLPPYYYVINYGKMITGEDFVPARGKFVPGSFEGNRPEPALVGGVEKFNYKDGTAYGMYPKNPVRPMNYIQATSARINANLRNLLMRLKTRGINLGGGRWGWRGKGS